MKRQRTPRQIIESEKRMAILKDCYQLTRTLAIGILYDDFDFSEEDALRFLDSFDFHVKKIGENVDNIEEVKANIKELFGIEI